MIQRTTAASPSADQQARRRQELPGSLDMPGAYMPDCQRFGASADARAAFIDPNPLPISPASLISCGFGLRVNVPMLQPADTCTAPSSVLAHCNEHGHGGLCQEPRRAAMIAYAAEQPHASAGGVLRSRCSCSPGQAAGRPSARISTQRPVFRSSWCRVTRLSETFCSLPFGQFHVSARQAMCKPSPCALLRMGAR